MSRWFRFYDDAINDPKALRLSDSLHRSWVGLLCIASKNDGVLPSMDDIAIMLRSDVSSVEKFIAELIERELIDRVRGGELCPHNWRKRQYKSDISTDRVKRFRKRRETVSETPPETEQIQNTDTEKKDTRTVAKATRPQVASKFEEFWKVYPRRLGSSPRGQAEELFIAAVKRGADPDEIIAGAVRFAAQESENIGTKFIPQAVKWIRNRGWIDGSADPPAPGLSDEERKQMFEKLRKPNEQRAGTDLRSAGFGARKIEEAGRQEPTAHADNQTRHAGMARLDTVFREPSGVRADSDETGSDGIEPRVYSTG